MRLTPSEAQQREMRYACLLAAAYLAFYFTLPPALAAGLGVSIELLFAGLIFSRAAKLAV